MLGKFVKQEIKVQGKAMEAVCGVLAAATVLMLFMYGIERIVLDSFFEGAYYVACGIYMMTIVMAVAAAFIYLCYHFYQSMYTEQGYLTHTLPLKPTEILHAKILVSFCSFFLTIVLSILSFALNGLLRDGLHPGELIDIISLGLHEMEKDLQVSVAVIAVFLLVLAVTGCLSALLLFFAGSSIGQLFQRSRGVCGIAAGIGLYYLSQLITLGAVAAAYFLYMKWPDIKPAWLMAGGIFVMLFWAAVYYMICRVIVQRHLNLE